MLLASALPLVFSAFVAGILMFLAPCTLPLIPGYLAFIGGTQESQIRRDSSRLDRKKIVTNALFFSAGFTLVFVSFGIAAGFAGSLIGPLRMILVRIAGIFVILFGLLMLNVLSIPFLNASRTIRLPKIFIAGKPSTSFFMGGAFAIGWTPCVGPVLATVLLLASVTNTAFYGGFLLFVFSLGLSLPFMITAFALSKIAPLFSEYHLIAKIATVIGGIFLLLIGILLITGQFALTLLFQGPAFQFLQNFY